MDLTRLLRAVAVAATLTATACGSSSSPTDSVGPGSGGGATVHLAEPANGTTVTAHVGDHLVVTLHSTYWALADPSGAVLSVGTAPSIAGGGSGCPHAPGTGCGTVTATYDVNAAGTARLSASRQSCGEAMRCTGNSGNWTVTVTAS
ncbi:MAG: hypothetical protein QOF18_2419 [Frankiaceae bacterium]|jgi:hypothetical protein|nr:hypothetical protein [Frankiaceae bacterium]